MAKILNSIVEATGQTPLVKLNRLDEGLPGNVAVKLEFYNPAGSVKDRIGRAIIDAAEKSGALKPGGTIVEGTSGNTGIALAMVGAARGYRVILTMPETMSAERRVLLRAYGAQIVLTPGTEGMRGAVEKAKEIVATTENAILASQFSNEANPAIHYNTTGPEIWEATDGKVDIFVAGIGTGGTISGTGKYLKEQNPNAKGVAVEPTGTTVVAPAAGKVAATYPSGHAVGLKLDNGVELLVHVGLDTVNLDGEGFTVKVKKGDQVAAGDTLIEFDPAVIKKAGYPLITPVIVTNTRKFASVEGVVGNANNASTVLKVTTK